MIIYDYYAKAVCESAVHTYGKEHQKLIAIEEMSELTKALCKDTRYPDNPSVLENVAEEIADVRIMLDQLEYIYKCSSDVVKYKQMKIRRLADRINKAQTQRGSGVR